MSWTDSHGSSEWFWNTTARSGPGSLTSRSSSSTAPVVTVVRPATMFSKVDFPQPEWPMMETYSPVATASDTSLSTEVVLVPRAKLLST